jgi:hypothetical protein
VPFIDRQKTLAGATPLAAAGCVVLAGAVLAGCTAPLAPTPPVSAIPAASPGTSQVLPYAVRARDWDEFRLDAARRIVAANPGRSYDGQVPEVLLAIPVIEVELNGDGSIRRLSVSRQPRQALDTVPIALDAVRRAAPFGSVAHLPKPWTFTEVFLFDDQRRFKPRTLDF